MKSLLIAGTNTDVGKTILMASLIAYRQKYLSQKKLGVMKLIQTGLGDYEFLSNLFDCPIVVPLRFKEPLAPPISAKLEGKTVDLKLVWQELVRLQKENDFVLIEALGGLGSPMTEELTVADIAGEWRLDTVLVADVRLGAIAQIVANVAIARQCKVKLKGIILNCVEDIREDQLENLAPQNLIQQLTNIPILGTIPHLKDCQDLDKLSQVASNLSLFDGEYLK
jgi:dethiobiotin synthetase